MNKFGTHHRHGNLAKMSKSEKKRLFIRQNKRIKTKVKSK